MNPAHSGQSVPTIVVIGSGFSGTMTTVHLLRSSATARVILIERSGRFGPGLAYSTPSPVHFLNVPAGNMSAFDDDPGHFLDWARRRDPSLTGGSFLPRGWYGEYLQSVLAAERLRPANAHRLREITGRALAVESAPDGVTVSVETSGHLERIHADRVVLAAGNALPAHPGPSDDAAAFSRVLNSPAYIHNPWDAAAMDSIRADEPLLILGTGLTMMDVVMALSARDHTGKILALSRRGLLSRPHRSPSRPPTHRDPPAGLRPGGTWNGSIRMLVRLLRQAVRESAGRGTDWRDVVSSIRSITPDLWQRLDRTERERFLSRVRPYWDIVRHRAAPETAAAVSDLIASRRLSVRAGRLLRLAAAESGVEATFRPRGSSLPQSIRVARIINCMGPDTDVRRSTDPLLRQLLESGQIVPDVHALGLHTARDGWSIGSDGRPSARLLVAGPMRRSAVWENTAVPELRKEAAAIARSALAVTPDLVVRNVLGSAAPTHTHT